MEKKIPSKYKTKKIDLNGSAVHAWDMKNSLAFLNSDDSKSFAILGGDVLNFNIEKSRYEYSYDNWHLERNGPSESFHDYSQRSRLKALEYVSNYPISVNTLFVFTLSSELTAGL